MSRQGFAAILSISVTSIILGNQVLATTHKVFLKKNNYCSYKGVAYEENKAIEVEKCPHSSIAFQAFQEVLELTGYKNIGVHFWVTKSVSDFLAIMSTKDRMIVVNPDVISGNGLEKSAKPKKLCLIIAHLLHHVINNHFIYVEDIPDWKLHRMELNADFYSGIIFSRRPQKSRFDSPFDESAEYFKNIAGPFETTNRKPNYKARIMKIQAGCLDEYAREMRPNDVMTIGKRRIIKTVTTADIYYGMVKRKKRHGFGCERLANGSEYAGGWSDGQKNGFGILERGDEHLGSLKFYMGDFKNNVFHGQGTAFWSTGTKYSGKWEEGRMVD